MTDVIDVAGVVVWTGPRNRSQRRVKTVARWRERYPTRAAVLAKLGFLPAADDDAPWTTLTLTRTDDGRPVSRCVYHTNPLGEITSVECD